MGSVVRTSVVVGGGIVGLAVARALQRLDPGTPVVVLEKEESVAAHQTGHNSGVVHSGLYYKPGSLKARLAVAGGAALKEYCDEKGIPLEVPGKLVVATTEAELPQLDRLFGNGEAERCPGTTPHPRRGRGARTAPARERCPGGRLHRSGGLQARRRSPGR